MGILSKNAMNGIVNVLICCLLAIGIAILSMIELFEKCQCAMMHSLIQKDAKLKSLNILWIICCCNIHWIMMMDQRVILFLELFQKKKDDKEKRFMNKMKDIMQCAECTKDKE